MAKLKAENICLKVVFTLEATAICSLGIWCIINTNEGGATMGIPSPKRTKAVVMIFKFMLDVENPKIIKAQEENKNPMATGSLGPNRSTR